VRGVTCKGFWWEFLREREQLGGLGVDGKIILGRIFRKWDLGVRTGLSWLIIGVVEGYYE
jgi:hypothetical protein